MMLTDSYTVRPAGVAARGWIKHSGKGSTVIKGMRVAAGWIKLRAREG